MHRHLVIAASAFAATVGCNSSSGSGVKPLAPIEPQSGQMINVSSVTATVLGVRGLQPACPLRPHAEGALAVRGVSGVIQYRWERGDSTYGPLQELTVPPPGPDSIARARLAPDEWADTVRGVQREVTEQVHVSYPFTSRSAPVMIEVKCY
ncbi:MAG: hypothetical protein ACREK8_08280 [Gemmatimonadales bacterium]